MNPYALWFRRIVWLGALVNIALGIFLLAAPNTLLGGFGLPPIRDAMWPRLAALLLILMSLFYFPVGRDPLRWGAAAWLPVLARVGGATFFFAAFPQYFPFGLMEAAFALSEGALLALAHRQERGKRPISRSVGAFLAATAALILVVLAAGWYHLFREEPTAYADDATYYKYGSVGTEAAAGIPYWIWRALPTLFPEHLGAGAEGRQADGIGFLDENGETFRWDRPNARKYETPVGFAVKTIGFARVGVNCATCHITSYRTSEDAKPILVLGAPGQRFDTQAYLRFLYACASDPRFTADNLLREIGKYTRLSPTESLLYRFALIPQTKKALLEQKQNAAWMDTRPRWGRGRIDPFNPVKFGMLRQPLDDTIGNSDMLPLWELADKDGWAYHWDGLATSLTEVVRSSALGDGATEYSIPLKDLDRLQKYIGRLSPPPYPRPLDPRLRQAGLRIYQRENCGSCHEEGGARFREVIPVREKELGTDDHRIEMWTASAARAYNNYVRDPEWRFHGFQDRPGYIGLPLHGLWLTAPYLHNGSVPTLRDLLKAPKDRPRVFYRGYDVYDFASVGFVTTGANAERLGFRFDTGEPGNSSQGHLYGTQLPENEKRALLEYLKSL